MKKVLLLPLLSCLSAPLSAELPFYRASEHFKMYCMPDDQKVADLILTKDEVDLKQLESDFQHTLYGTSNPGTQVTLEMYPNIEAFHAVMGNPQAPNWIIFSIFSNKKMLQFVSPNNPGNYHTYDSWMLCNKISIIQLVLDDMFPQIPQWLMHGITYYKSDWKTSNLSWLVQHQKQIPTLEQLESAGNDAEKFEALRGFRCAYWLGAFLFEKWGWDTIKALMADYDKFEQILGVSKKEFMQRWIEFLIQKSK